jgi:nitroimidazol reductase NimA-like FMN-containing flavoprotein (pyridoxamine 5'-phosphate oxidase superfamily)
MLLLKVRRLENDVLEILTNEKSVELLQRNTHGRLGCVLESGEPYVVPINYYFDGSWIFCLSAAGLKLSALQANPNTCLQVYEVDGQFRWKSVIAFGEYEEVHDAGERKQILDTFQRRFSLLTPAAAVGLDKRSGDVVAFRINMKRITGRMET